MGNLNLKTPMPKTLTNLFLSSGWATVASQLGEFGHWIGTILLALTSYVVVHLLGDRIVKWLEKIFKLK